MEYSGGLCVCKNGPEARPPVVGRMAEPRAAHYQKRELDKQSAYYGSFQKVRNRVDKLHSL